MKQRPDSLLHIHSQIKAGDIHGHTGTNHNETLEIATRVRAGGGPMGATGTNHNETLAGSQGRHA